jgi:hypothetical protein
VRPFPSPPAGEDARAERGRVRAVPIRLRERPLPQREKEIAQVLDSRRNVRPFQATTARQTRRHQVRSLLSDHRFCTATYAAHRNRDNRRRTCTTIRRAIRNRSDRICSSCDTKPRLASLCGHHDYE